MAEAWTVRRVVAWIQGDFERRGITSARLEADLIISRVLAVKRIALYLDLERPLVDGELADIRALVERRRAHEPMAYILGEREFFSRSFEVNRDVLIPRPDTETLVDVMLAELRPKGEGVSAAELCVGSGALIVTLAAELPKARCVATDISAAALLVAARKCRSPRGCRTHLVSPRAIFFGALHADERFDAIAINPPYIRSDVLATLDPDVRDFEPVLALDGGADGLVFYRRIAHDVRAFLAPGALVAVEVGYDQAREVCGLFEGAGLTQVTATRDLAGVERVVSAREPVPAA